MLRVRLLCTVLVLCVLACDDTTQPVLSSPPAGILAAVAPHTDGPAVGLGCFEDSLNFTIDGPHMAVAVTLMEPPDTTTACGNIEFNGQLRTIEVAYSIGKAEPPYVYWWSGARDADAGTYLLDTLEQHILEPEVDTTFTDSLWLRKDYDGIGVVGVNSADSAFAVADSVFTKALSGEFGRNYMLQHWAEKLPPASIGAQVSGFVVTLSWTNRHGNREIDSTVVFRDGVLRTTRDYLAQSFVDTVPGYDTYVYRLKHVAGPLINEINGALVSPNSPSSDSLVVTVGTACARRVESTSYVKTWRQTDQYLSAGCSELGADKRFRWYGAGDTPLSEWSSDTLFDFPGHTGTGAQIVILKDSNTTTHATSRDTLTFSVYDGRVVLSGPTFVADKAKKLYVATADTAHWGKWYERYDDGPQWYAASAYDQDTLLRRWPYGDYTVALRQHKYTDTLKRGRLAITVCSVPGCEPNAPAAAAAPEGGDATVWGLFGAGPWLGWGSPDLGRTLRLYDLWGAHDRLSPFGEGGWLLDDGGTLVDPVTDWEVRWAPRELGLGDVRAFDLTTTNPRARGAVFSMAVDPDLGTHGGDDVASYDAGLGLVLVADGEAAVGLLLVDTDGGDNALVSVQEYGVGRWAPGVSAAAWAAQREAGLHLRGTPGDVQLLLSAAPVDGGGTWTFVVLRGSTPTAVRARAEEVRRALR